MNTGPYHRPLPPDFARAPIFSVLDMTAWYDFKTESSICFSLGYIGGENNNPLGLVDDNIYHQRGWVTVHHPLAHHVKARVQCCLPDEYLETEKMSSVVTAVFTVLEIPLDETYIASFVSPIRRMGLSEHRDRNGSIDVMISKKHH